MASKDFPSISEAQRRYPHGSHARYVLARCRCELCSAANRTYEKDRQARRRPPYHLKYSPSGDVWVVRHAETKKIVARARTKATAKKKLDNLNAQYSTSSELIATTEVVDHIRWLQAQCIGVKTISKRSGVASSVLSRMLDGDIARTRRSTAAKVLSVGPDAVKGGARMRADDSLALIASLVDAGYTRTKIAHSLGSSSDGLQVARSGWISVTKARQIHNLYLRLAAKDPAIPKISSTFKIGELESSLLRHHGRGSKTKTSTKAVLAPHGTAARARAGCNCKACVRAERLAVNAKSRFGQLRYIARLANRRWVVLDTVAATTVFRTNDKSAAFAIAADLNAKDPRASLTMLVDATRAREHLQSLHAQGTTAAAMSRACGISPAQLHSLMRGRSRRTSARTANAILGLSPTAMPTEARIDGSQTYLLVDRLQAVGFDVRWLATVLDLPATTFTSRAKSIPLERARDISALYAALRDRVPTLELLEKAA